MKGDIRDKMFRAIESMKPEELGNHDKVRDTLYTAAGVEGKQREPFMWYTDMLMTEFCPGFGDKEEDD